MALSNVKCKLKCQISLATDVGFAKHAAYRWHRFALFKFVLNQEAM